MTTRFRNCVVAAASLLILSTGVLWAADAPPKEVKPKLPVLTPSAIDSQLDKLGDLDKQCQVGTFDVRWVSMADLPDSETMTLALACASFTKNRPRPSKEAAASVVGRRSEDLARMARLMRGAVFDRGTPVSALCRGEISGGAQHLTLARCELGMSAIRGNLGSAAFCQQAKAKGLADANYGCTPADKFFDADPASCPTGSGSVDCREMGALLKAWRSGAPKDCAASPFCKVIASQDVRDCDAYLKQANKAFCDTIVSEVGQMRKAAAENARFAREKEEQRQRLELEKKRQTDAREAAELARKSRKNFKKGEPMQAVPPDVEKRLKMLAPKPEGK